MQHRIAIVKIAIIGANGLIGSALAARLARDGHDITGLQHSSQPACNACVRSARIDIAKAGEEEWVRHLSRIDLCINAAGVFQDSSRDDTAGVHAEGPARLFRACQRAQVRRVIHFSAIGVDRAQPSPFSASKWLGEQALMQSGLDWVILRPSVVLGSPVYGASALMRGLAALPWRPSMSGTGALQPVQLDDVVATVAFFTDLRNPARVALDLAGPDRFSMDEIIDRHRAWLGWPTAKRLVLPEWLALLAYRLGDAAAMLGWRPPVRSNAALEMRRGAIGDPGEWARVTGIEATSLDRALKNRPATVQDRWFAGLYPIKPLIFVVLPLFWIATAVISLTIGWDIGVELMRAGGAGLLSEPSVVAGALADFAVGAMIAWRKSARAGLWAAIALSLFYAIAGTVVRPDLWAEPLGPFLKIFPIILLHMVALAILRDR